MKLDKIMVKRFLFLFHFSFGNFERIFYCSVEGAKLIIALQASTIFRVAKKTFLLIIRFIFSGSFFGFEKSEAL